MLFASIGRVFGSSPPAGMNVDTEVGSAAAAPVIQHLLTLRYDCEGLGLAITLAKVDRLIQRLRTSQMTHRELDTECTEVSARLTDELDQRLCFTMDAVHGRYYSEFTLEWGNVLDRFPSVALDIEEASKCLALDRFTASVFHLMRVMETALRATGKALDIPETSPTWDAILTKIDNELKGSTGKSPEWRRHERFFAETNAHLRSVKTAWRNPTMHITSAYDEERASDVFATVRSMMRHIALHLDESGNWNT